MRGKLPLHLRSVLLLVAVSACGGGELRIDDGAGGQGGEGGTPSPGGGPADGGAGAAGGNGGEGAAGGPSDGGTGGGEGGRGSCDDPATCEYDLETTCRGEPAFDPSNLPACDAALCPGGGIGHCVPTSLVPADTVALLADCSGTTKCVPDDAIERNGLFTAPTCESVAGYEGRCLSTCIPAVADQVELLPQSSCDPDERCAPCYDPFTGADTGACSLSCDPGPAEPAATFPRCCEDLGGGACVPIQMVGEEAAADLDADECASLNADDSVCVPDVITAAHLQGELFTATSCTTNLLVQLGGGSAAGGCLPKCIPEVNDTAGLTQESCPEDFNCVPCTRNGTSTGACDPS